MLTISGRKHAVAVFCDEDEPFEAPSGRFGNTSPVSQALALADRERVDWVILTRASEIRLYAARPDTGVGRKGRAETFVELNLSLVPDELAGYLHLLFSAAALEENGTLEEILDRSADYVADLASRLRERVYRETVSDLANAVAARLSSDRHRDDLTENDLADAYEQVMVILFRLLFVAYAEDKNLLPYRTNGRYADHSLSRKARLLAEDRHEGRGTYDNQATDLWDDVNQLWDAVNRGNGDWGVPAYNGGLFSTDPEVSRSGAAIADMKLTNAEFGPALSAVLVDRGPEGIGPVDFRSLSVREFGTIYEGLLESKLSVAQDDLTVRPIKGEDQFVPAFEGDEVEVEAGAVYFHNRSGARKATGSYFTKPFAVEHLLDNALEPALDDHIFRLDELRESGDNAALADAFFDFRCADIAMGSAHFLVAAVDRIEARLSAWLSLHPVAPVTGELNRLREAAFMALGELADGVEVESSSLLRRQVARHCIYGVDKNRIAVELARLAIWVHTFVPGLPLSFLDHNLIQGDSLSGVATLDEVVSVLDPDVDHSTPSLFRGQFEDLLSVAKDALRRLARTSDATKREIDEARSAHQEAQDTVAELRTILDVITAHRAEACSLPEKFEVDAFARLAQRPAVVEQVATLQPVHFPTDFPEVFLRDDPGFDCLIGNPPWEQVVVQEHVWWGTYLPRIRGLATKQMNDEITRFRRSRPDLEAEFERELEEAEEMREVLRNVFPDLGSGRTDLYKAFAWRNWYLTRQSTGRIGIVLPRTALQTKGSEGWRKTVLEGGAFSDVVMLLNTGGWVFDEVHGQYTVALCSLCKRKENLGTVTLGGPYSGWPEYVANRKLGSESIPVDEFISWSEDAGFPQLPAHPGASELVSQAKGPPNNR